MSTTAGHSERTPRGGLSSRPKASVRIDRLGRAAICIAAVVLAFFYIKPLIGLAGAAFASNDASSELAALKRENHALIARRDALRGDRGVAAQARRLGMVLPGEVPYVVTGLPAQHN